MARLSRNIVICCDGTGNQFSNENSNVVKIYTSIDVKEEQVAYYHPGVGTMGSATESTFVGKRISKYGGLAFGIGFTDTVMDAYKYLMETYAEGDRIFLFGFSRGAYTVRALAGVLYVYGLLCPGNEGHFDYVMRMYSETSRNAYADKRKRMPKDPISDAFKETFSREVPIQFMGIWDTVSSVGWIYDPVKLLFDGQNPIVRTCRHAVSVDERRCFFQDNLWGAPLPVDQTPLLKGYQQDVVQAWFAGVHSDVGGSYPQSECGPSEDALRWMLDEAEEAGLIVHQTKRAAVFGDVTTGFPAIGALCRAPGSMERLHDSLKGFYWVLEFFPHEFYDGEGKRHWQLAPWAHRREIPEGALLHPSLLRRLELDSTYQPPNLSRRDIALFRESPVPLPRAEVTAKLTRDNYGVYRPGAAPQKTAAAPSRIATAAAFVGGLAGLFWRR